MLCCVTIFQVFQPCIWGCAESLSQSLFGLCQGFHASKRSPLKNFARIFLGRTMNRSNTYPQGLDEYSTGIQRIQNWGDGMLVRSKMLCWYQHCQAPTEWSMPMQPGLSGRSRVDTSAFASGKVTFCTLQFHQQQTEDIKTNYEISKQHLH